MIKAAMEKTKILVIEDEQDIREGLGLLLGDSFAVDLAESGISGIKTAIRNPPDLILLDLNMPHLDGFQTCKALRAESEFKHTPIIILTAFNDAENRTKAFESGADDYIAKPFDSRELLARIHRKILSVKEAGSRANPHILVCQNLRMDSKNQAVSIDDKAIHLSPLEFRLLKLLLSHQGQLLSRQHIIETVWEKQDVSERIVDPHILSLRNKLDGFTGSLSSIYRGGYIIK
jgi:DNA-binding response OmpR family regulator